ncbi:hypothetical protein [Streptomyces rishiriensis]|uniref:hypothetical protein n=1 Tax=Streptomyces rishiriensis TaxID=68264 RepID=UPI0037D6113F
MSAVSRTSANRLFQQRLCPEVLVGCAADDECEGQAWVPAFSVTDLLRALTGELVTDPDVRCTIYRPHADDQEGDFEGRADFEAQYADAVRA